MTKTERVYYWVRVSFIFVAFLVFCCVVTGQAIGSIICGCCLISIGINADKLRHAVKKERDNDN